jgi:hypothetical protein
MTRLLVRGLISARISALVMLCEKVSLVLSGREKKVADFRSSVVKTGEKDGVVQEDAR